jgi:general secretion pathway protein G
MTRSRNAQRGGKATRRRGFTLIEVLLVLVILVVMGSMAVLAYGPIQRRANINAARTQIGLFKTPLQTYQLNVGSLPTTAQGLDALRRPPADLPNPAKWDATLDSEVPLDPWGSPYHYACPGPHNPDSYDVWSSGPDGIDGTADDIGNW